MIPVETVAITRLSESYQINVHGQLQAAQLWCIYLWREEEQVQTMIET